MLGKLKRTINSLLSPLGIEINRRNSASPLLSKAREKLREAAGEMEKLIRKTVLPALPQVEGRHELMAQLLGTQFSEALYIAWHLGQTLHLPGAICEFGVAQGATSALIANEIRNTTKYLWLFDSFEGLPKPTSKDRLIDDIFDIGSIDKYQGTMKSGQDQVVSRLNAIGFPSSRVKIIPGFIEKTSLQAQLPTEVCFAYVDFDFYEPIKIALELLDTRLPAGGRIIVDDYGYFSEGAQIAVDEFVEARSERYTKEPAPDWASRFCILSKIR